MSDHEHATLFSHMERASDADKVRALVRTDRISYSNQYDAYYCPECGEWVEPKCSNPTCAFCYDRPPRRFDGPALLRRRIKNSRIGLIGSLAIVWGILGSNTYYLYLLHMGAPALTALIAAALVISVLPILAFSPAFMKMPPHTPQGQVPAAESRG